MPTDRFLRLPSIKQERILNAAVEEFSERAFADANLANIVRNAGVARGSLYQYFDSKEDLYRYILSEISRRKMKFLNPLLFQNDNLSFLSLFRELFLAGIQFAQSEGMNQAHQLYESFVRRDQAKGRIRTDLDPELLARMITQLINNVTFEDFIQADQHYETLLRKVDQIILVLQKGMEPNHV
jgi:AcrR family transcriptional regulator